MKFKRFQLYRETDVTGISGTGTVVEGVQFSDGVVCLRWLGGTPSTVIYQDGIKAVEKIHGHNNSTRVVWLDQNEE